MFLKRLELQGFKTFAQKTGLEFVLDRDGRRGVTAIVGPNGSGKSNVADALRWVMGEQSMKLLRGKKSEDVIFSGSDKRARSGFCEVTMMLQNDDAPEIEFSELAITRRLYRDGNSEYEVNRKPARLQDVQLLLAQAGVGQRTYSVIGQGMIDQVLVASPSERKEFFDEAFGLRSFQLKRTSAVHKMAASKEHLLQTELLLQEIGPRLHTLEKQAKRLQERERLEEELRTLESQYYGSAWGEIERGTKMLQDRLVLAHAEQEKQEAEMRGLLEELGRLEKDVPVQEGFSEIRKKLDALKTDRAALRERQLHLESARAVAAVRAEKPWSPLPLSKIIESIEEIQAAHQALESLLEATSPDWDAIRVRIASLRGVGQSLLAKLQRPAPEPLTDPARDPELEAEFLAIAEGMHLLTERIVTAEQELDAWNRREQHDRKQVFELQHLLNQKRQGAHQIDRRVSEAEIERARLETKREGLLEELRRHAPNLEETLPALSQKTEPVSPESAGRLQRLRSQLEWIGGIDPEVIKEYEETSARFTFLNAQVEDVRAGLQALDLVVKELDETIRERSQVSFSRLNQEFSRFFKQLFQGGQGELIEIQAEPEVDEEGNVIESQEEKGIAGIDIQVTPPGKRLKSIALLSGGERALTSIALICAIMATNPSPFVVLDEVDAALDESNSRKFGEIISSLADKTQFIVITHNRATMAHGNVLYGVTMGDDGVSQLLSVKLEDLEKWRVQR